MLNILQKKIEKHVESIKKSVENQNWLAALSLAVTIPDICCRLDGTKPGSKSKEPYVNWFDTYVGKNYKFKPFDREEFIYFNGKNAYALRCSILHDGTGDISYQTASDKELGVGNIVFFEPKDVEQSQDGLWAERVLSIDGDILFLNVRVYCKHIVEGAYTWIENHKDCEETLLRSEKLMTVHNEKEYYQSLRNSIKEIK